MKSATLVGSLAAALIIAGPSLAMAQNSGTAKSLGNGYYVYNGSGGSANNGGAGSGNFNQQNGSSYRSQAFNGGYANNGYGNNTGAFGNSNYNGGVVGNGNGIYRNNGNSVFGNNANGPAANHPAIYANIGSGGYFGRPIPITNGNGSAVGNENGTNLAAMRASQRNAVLSDNGDVRASNMIGAGVFNRNNQHLGTVNDVLIGRNGVWAVVATGNKDVAVPFRDFVFGDANITSHDKVVLPAVSEAQLNSLPADHYHLPDYASYNGNNGGWFGHNNGGGWFANHGRRANGNNG